MKRISLLVTLGLVLAFALAMAVAVEAEAPKPQSGVNKELCAEKMRYGREAFHRGMFSQAKLHFREAITADPGNRTAWAFYDLSIMYDVAEQVKRAGKVVKSSAAAGIPGPPPGAPAAKPPAAPAPPPAASGGAPDVPPIPEDEGC